MSETRTTFKNNGEDFSGIRAAEEHVRGLGYSVGSMERNQPIGLVKGDCYISKWTRMTNKEHDELDGRFEGPDYRNGDVTVVLKTA